ncbi:hypothetical protein [Alteromonas sp. 14N.309.X.WAT.G.H12]|uniref:hypothetical protein n=1 Tax=Alteromonas sp. 14N.309.X.WAT.G.H12 TaxID=3120824 RepID=UPI002FD0E2BE
MTSDGISKKDWNQVEDLVANIVNLSAIEKPTVKAKKELFDFLDILEQKYGRVPSVLATKADYEDSPYISLSLLKEAYTTAFEMSDFKNMSYISVSLAELYKDSNRESLARFWLEIARKDSKLYSDDFVIDSIEELESQ